MQYLSIRIDHPQCNFTVPYSSDYIPEVKSMLLFPDGEQHHSLQVNSIVYVNTGTSGIVLDRYLMCEPTKQNGTTAIPHLIHYFVKHHKEHLKGIVGNTPMWFMPYVIADLKKIQFREALLDFLDQNGYILDDKDLDGYNLSKYDHYMLLDILNKFTNSNIHSVNDYKLKYSIGKF